MKTIEAILRTPSPFIRRGSPESVFTLVCTVAEGIACRFAASSWSDQILTPLAPDIIAELGWKTVEHAPRRQVVVRCRVRAVPPGVQAEIDRGAGFEALPVAREDAG